MQKIILEKFNNHIRMQLAESKYNMSRMQERSSEPTITDQ